MIRTGKQASPLSTDYLPHHDHIALHNTVCFFSFSFNDRISQALYVQAYIDAWIELFTRLNQRVGHMISSTNGIAIDESDVIGKEGESSSPLRSDEISGSLLLWFNWFSTVCRRISDHVQNESKYKTDHRHNPASVSWKFDSIRITLTSSTN